MSAALTLVANTRLPSERAQSLQVLQMAAAFARAGARTRLLYARRKRVLALPAGQDVFAYYAIPAGARPELRELECTDWIESVPRALQFAPARLQELSFARAAARAAFEPWPQAGDEGAAQRVLSRELETALALVKRGHARCYLEIHRVPGGRLRRRWLLAAARGCRGLIAISNGVARDLCELGIEPERVRVEHDGVEATRFADLPERAAARAELGLPQAARIAVYTGGLLEWKGVDLLVEAARALPQHLFVIAGGMRADVERLRERAGGLANLRIDGFQPPQRVGLYLAAADLGVVPNRSRPAISARYTSPLKVFEAKAVGLPLVASDLPSLREVLGEDEARFVAPDDAQALGAGLRALLEDPQLCARLGAAARARAGEHTWDARARRILVWMDACEARG